MSFKKILGFSSQKVLNPPTLMDLLQDPLCKQFPASLFICGDMDVLFTSSKRVSNWLSRNKSLGSELWSFNARHAFFGWPTNWTKGSWKTNALPCTKKLCDYLRKQADRVLEDS